MATMAAVLLQTPVVFLNTQSFFSSSLPEEHDVFSGSADVFKACLDKLFGYLVLSGRMNAQKVYEKACFAEVT
jgi:hypothetical protein